MGMGRYRNRRGLRGLGRMGDALSTLQASGWDPGILSNLVALGATDQQLQALTRIAPTPGNQANAFNLILNGNSSSQASASASMQYDPYGFLYDPLAASLGPVGIMATTPGGTQAFEASLGPVGAAIAAASGTPSSSGGGAAASNQPFSVGVWLAQNWMSVAIVVGAIAIIPPIIKKL